jgi:hypothetical protein
MPHADRTKRHGSLSDLAERESLRGRYRWRVTANEVPAGLHPGVMGSAGWVYGARSVALAAGFWLQGRAVRARPRAAGGP